MENLKVSYLLLNSETSYFPSSMITAENSPNDRIRFYNNHKIGKKDIIADRNLLLYLSHQSQLFSNNHLKIRFSTEES